MFLGVKSHNHNIKVSQLVYIAFNIVSILIDGDSGGGSVGGGSRAV